MVKRSIFKNLYQNLPYNPENRMIYKIFVSSNFSATKNHWNIKCPYGLLNQSIYLRFWPAKQRNQQILLHRIKWQNPKVGTLTVEEQQVKHGRHTGGVKQGTGSAEDRLLAKLGQHLG